MKKTAFTISALTTVSAAFAYIDPGTGVAVIGSLGPLVLAFFSAILAFLIKVFWNPIKSLFLKFKNLNLFKRK